MDHYPTAKRYYELGKEFALHQAVNHNKDVRYSGVKGFPNGEPDIVTTNTVEKIVPAACRRMRELSSS